VTRNARTLACVLIVLASTFIAGCDEGGIGMGLPSGGSVGGSRWGGGSSGPSVFVGGGPVYR
jgi:predicted small secreted protein